MILVLKADHYMAREELNQIQKDLIRQVKEGIVIIPRQFQIAHVMNNPVPLEIKVSPDVGTK